MEGELATVRATRTALEGLRVLLQRVRSDVATYAANCDALGGKQCETGRRNRETDRHTCIHR